MQQLESTSNDDCFDSEDEEECSFSDQGLTDKLYPAALVMFIVVLLCIPLGNALCASYKQNELNSLARGICTVNTRLIRVACHFSQFSSEIWKALVTFISAVCENQQGSSTVPRRPATESSYIPPTTQSTKSPPKSPTISLTKQPATPQSKSPTSPQSKSPTTPPTNPCCQPSPPEPCCQPPRASCCQLKECCPSISSEEGYSSSIEDSYCSTPTKKSMPAPATPQANCGCKETLEKKKSFSLKGMFQKDKVKE